MLRFMFALPLALLVVVTPAVFVLPLLLVVTATFDGTELPFTFEFVVVLLHPTMEANRDVPRTKPARLLLFIISPE